MSANDNRHVIAVADPAALAATAAEHVLARTAANRGRVAICLTGGSSPKQLYELLATEPYRDRMPWHRVHWFIGDERFVPADDPLHNMGMARAAFLEPMRTAGQHPSDSDRDRRPRIPTAARRCTNAELQSFYGADTLDPRPAAVRSGADGRRTRRPYRVAVSRLSRPRRDPRAGSSACPRRMSSRSCRG